MSLKEQLEAVTAGFMEQAPAEVLGAFGAAAEKLAATGLAAQALKPGAKIPTFELPDATGKTVRSSELLARGPLVITFYRGNWCPYCNLELRALQARLADIQAAGATLIAISPEQPDQSLTTQEKNELKFTLLSDRGNGVAKQFGLSFELDATLRPIYAGFGVDLPARNGEAGYSLPLPATYVVAQDGTILNAFVDTDYTKRLEPDTVISWLSQLRAAA